MADSTRDRWRRRALSIPMMLAVTVVALVGAPLLIPAAAALDLVRFRTSLPTVRLYLFGLQYLINDSVEILVAPLYWAMAGFGTRLDEPASIERHDRLQWWSLDLMARRAGALLGLRVEVDGGAAQALTPGPAIVISRHVSLFDISLPGLVYRDLGYRVRGVIMAELLADPGFDLIYARSGSAFIPRDGGAEALAAVQRLAAGADERTAVVIFPEGRLFRPHVRDRLLERLRARDPERADRLAGLCNLLPPRPGGVLALLDALPDADVVVLDHRGLDRFPRLADLAGRIPVREPVEVVARRIARADIPGDEAGRTRWLDDLWLAIDRELEADRAAAG